MSDDDETPTPSARRGLNRILDAYSGEHAVYGLVLVTALVAVGWEEDTDFEVLLFVVGTVVIFWLAHIYAAVVASRAEHPAKPMPAAIGDGARHASGMLVAMLVPAALLLLGTVGLVEEYTAYFLALASGIVMLAVIGYANAARNGSSWPWRIAGLVATTLLGMLVIGLSILAH
ncbi:hypothetical protein [Microbacterium kyungheense]|uniref:Integral membrane protein n=1 Tax=Microbacterium kyungheense TaxID=1263636 RepID=A0A543F3D1_9MICO|nr:hypothetical protein [Microbacterium kyungheense]TQM28325.1 hypothetical protein FB391_2388 [Microbacterium kyungheense]